MRDIKLLYLAVVAALLTMSAASRADSLLERIAATVLGEKFGIDTQAVGVFRQQTDLPIYDLAPIYEGAYYFHQPPTTVWQLRRQGLGWGEIAHRLGMNPGTFNKLRNQGAFDRDRFWTATYRDRFGVPNDRIVVLRRDNGSLEDVLGAIVIGKLSHKDPHLIYTQYRTARSWPTVAKSYNVRLEDWKRVSTPVRVRYAIPSSPAKSKTKSNQGVRDHGAGVGKGKSKGQSEISHGKGKGNSKGKSSSKAVLKGPGRGEGSSHGKGGGVGPGSPGKGGGQGPGNGKGKGKGKGG